MKLSILTWNILADSYIHGQASKVAMSSIASTNSDIVVTPSTSSTTTECHPLNHQDWSYRYPFIHRCLSNSDADIYCLQEVDHYSEAFHSYFQHNNYEPFYLQRPNKKDGCVIAYNKAQFEVIEKYELDFDKRYSSSIENEKKFLKQNVALFLKLKCLHSSQEFVLCNTHIHWNPNLSDVKITQILQILTHLSIFSKCTNSNHQQLPIILTGDFNILPTDPIYHILTNINNIATFKKLVRYNITGDRSMEQYYYGPTTRFLCDTSLVKLCKWLRILGVNTAMDSWDSGTSYTRNRMKLNRLTAIEQDDNILKKSALLLEKDSYQVRKSSINSFFERARSEKRVILTTSKNLRERSSCPYSYYIDPTNLKQSLLNVFKDFGLNLTKEQLLTVCGKCGDEVEPVDLTDQRLQGRWLPNDREVFACINCAQPYWWNEKEDSLPAQAMKRAEELYQFINTSLHNPSYNPNPTVVDNTDRADDNLKSDVNNTSDLISSIDLSIDNSNSYKELLKKDKDDLSSLDALMGQFQLRNKTINQKTLQDTNMIINQTPQDTNMIIDPLNGATQIPYISMGCNNTHKSSISMKDNRNDIHVSEDISSGTTLNQKPNSTLGHIETNTTVEALLTEISMRSDEGVPLKSVFTQQSGMTEPNLTNWNGEFKATLDYIFISNHWHVSTARVYPNIEGNNNYNNNTNITTSNDDNNIKRNGINDQDNVDNPLLNNINSSQPSLLWPSDHFIVQATLVLP